MLVSIVTILFKIILFLLSLLSWVILIYVIMALVIPQNKYTLLIGRYVEPLLAPIRSFLFRIFPKLRQMGIDFSPLGLYLLIQIAAWFVRLLYQIII